MKPPCKADIHLVLISDQVLPNITPILDDRFKPKQVILLVSDDKQKQADQLEKIYRPRGIQVVRWSLDSPWDIELIRDEVMDLMDKYENKAIALNATCGTKPMSIAAYEVFRSLNKAIFYIHPEKDRLVWLYPDSKSGADLANKIKLKEYLIAHGADEVKVGHTSGVKPAIRELTETLIGNIKDYSSALSTLNYLAGMAVERRLRSPEIGKDKKGDYKFWRLIDHFQQAGLLRIDNNQLLFPDEEARFMVNGGWLEMYVYACCLNLINKLGIQDVARSIEITRKRGKEEIMNEIDIGLLHNNRLYLLECKTKKYKYDEGSEVLYKLDSLREHIGGIQARTMLISVNRLKKHNINRAKELKINYCMNTDLKNLQHIIKKWLENSR